MLNRSRKAKQNDPQFVWTQQVKSKITLAVSVKKALLCFSSYLLNARPLTSRRESAGKDFDLQV